MTMKINAISFTSGIIAALILTCGADTAKAQEYVAPPVTISKEKVRIDGRIFYSHIVLEKQTLYSISKAYGISIEDIYEYNPTVKELGLQKNSIILIPADAISKEEKNDSEGDGKSEKSGKSERRKTVTSEEPQKEKATEEVQKEQTETPTESSHGERSHAVKWYEDLTSISEKYGVSEEAIMAANGLTNRKLTKRQILVIPSEDNLMTFKENIEEEVEKHNDEKEIAVDTTAILDTLMASDFNIEQPIDSVYNSPYFDSILKKNVEVTLLLPLKATGSGGSKGNMDFYCGALMAAREVAEDGISVDMNVYDIGEGTINAPQHVLESSDLIIGPVSNGDITRLYEYYPAAGPVISPLDPRVETLASKYPTLVHVPSPHVLQYVDAVNWIKEDQQEGDKVVVIFNKNKEADITEEITSLKNSLDSAKVEYSSFSYSILEGRTIQQSLTALMTPTGTNRVIIASESEAFVNDAVRNLNLLVASKLNVVLYGTSKTCSFETIEVENLHNTSLHASLRYYIDYDDPEVQDFIMKYRALFNTEPTQFAFQGYDVTKYFILNCARAGLIWKRVLQEKEMNMLQNSFKFRSINDGKGLVNVGIKRIVYGKDYLITPVE